MLAELIVLCLHVGGFMLDVVLVDLEDRRLDEDMNESGGRLPTERLRNVACPT